MEPYVPDAGTARIIMACVFAGGAIVLILAMTVVTCAMLGARMGRMSDEWPNRRRKDGR